MFKIRKYNFKITIEYDALSPDCPISMRTFQEEKKRADWVEEK